MTGVSRHAQIAAEIVRRTGIDETMIKRLIYRFYAQVTARRGGLSYDIAKASVMVDGPIRKPVDMKALGLLSLDGIDFRPTRAEIFPEARRLFAANDNEVSVAYSVSAQRRNREHE